MADRQSPVAESRYLATMGARADSGYQVVSRCGACGTTGGDWLALSGGLAGAQRWAVDLDEVAALANAVDGPRADVLASPQE